MIGTVATTNSFQNTLRYVARDNSERIYANFSGGVIEDVNATAKQMAVKAELSDRVQKPCYHIAISPAPEDELSKDDWVDFTQDFLSEMELDDRQVAAWLHHDEEFPDGSPRPHLHLVVNRVGSYGKAYSTSWDYRKVDEVLRELEDSYELQSVTPAEDAEVKRDTPGQVHRIEQQQAQYEDPTHPRTKPPKPSKRTQIQAAIDEAIEATASPEGIAAFLHRHGINTRFSEQGWSFEKDGVAFAGNQLGSRYAMGSVEQTIMVDSSEQAPKSPQQRQQQRRRTMADIMKAGAEKRESRSEATYEAKDMQRSGRRLMRQSEEVDGLTFIGGAIAGVGALAEASTRFDKALERARTRAESERAVEQIDKLEAIGDRTGQLEQQLAERFEADDLDTLDERLENDAFDTPDEGEDWIDDLDTDGHSHPFEDSYSLANRRLDTLGRHLDVELERAKPIHIDPTASVGQQLDQMDEAIAQLDERLGTLEESIQKSEQTVAPQQPEPALREPLREAGVAESLENFVNARTQFRGETEPSTFTSSVGRVELTREGFQGRDQRLTITDDDFGTVLEATKEDGADWETQIDELTDEQRSTLARLPQSGEAYGQYKRGQQLVDTFQSLPQTAERFEGDRGSIRWDSGTSGPSAFDYGFSIERQANGTQQITGRDLIGDQAVFNASVDKDGTIFVDTNKIPGEHTNKLIAMRQQELTPPAREQIREQVPRRSQQRELEL